MFAWPFWILVIFQPQAAWVNCRAPLLARYDMVDSTPPEWIQAYEDELLFSVRDMWLFLSRSYDVNMMWILYILWYPNYWNPQSDLSTNYSIFLVSSPYIWRSPKSWGYPKSSSRHGWASVFVLKQAWWLGDPHDLRTPPAKDHMMWISNPQIIKKWLVCSISAKIFGYWGSPSFRNTHGCVSNYGTALNFAILLRNTLQILYTINH